MGWTDRRTSASLNAVLPTSMGGIIVEILESESRREVRDIPSLRWIIWWNHCEANVWFFLLGVLFSGRCGERITSHLWRTCFRYYQRFCSRRPSERGVILERKKTSLSVLFIVGPKCTLAASHTGATMSRPTGLTDGRTPDRHITLSARRGHRCRASWIK